MRTTMFLSLIGTFALLGSDMGMALAQTPAVSASGDLVVLDMHPIESGSPFIRFTVPESGRTWDWALRDGQGPSGIAQGPPGIVYASIGDGSTTSIYLVDAGALATTVSPRQIARLPGRAVAWKRSVDGSRLLILMFASRAGEPFGIPSGLTSIALPSTMRGAPVPGSGTGDSSLFWYTVVSGANPDTLFDFHLKRATLGEGQEPAIEDLHAVISPYYSLIPSPAGDAVYLVDYGAQTIQVVDTRAARVTRSVIFGDRYFKRPPCAAALSPDGHRLYLIGNSPAGILVYDTQSWRRVSLFDEPGGTAFSYCLGVSRDGQRLFVTSDGAMVTLDAKTGKERDRMPLGENILPSVAIVTTTGR